MGYTVFAKARERVHQAGDNGPGGERRSFFRCGREWSTRGSTHEGLTAKQVETIRAEPELTDVLVFEEGVDVDLGWDG